MRIMYIMSNYFRLILPAAAMTLNPVTGYAQSTNSSPYPARLIKIVVPYLPGGGTSGRSKNVRESKPDGGH
jgi:tripartite-type tricarboxylate transporter receptor subunit TctC